MATHRSFTTLHHQFFHLLSTIILLSGLPLAFSDIKNTHILSDSRPTILFDRFGFSTGGHATVSIRGVSWKSTVLQNTDNFDPNLMGFFLIREAHYSLIMNESQYTTDHFCTLSSHFINLILKFEDLNVDSTCNGSVVIDDPDEYSLLFGNCQTDLEVTMEVHTEMYNLEGGGGGDKDYLPAGLSRLPKIYFAFSIIYSLFLSVWIFVCIKQRPTIDKIHIVMGSLLLFKALKLICAAEDTWYVKKTGSAHGWDVAFYVFGFFKGVLLFSVIVLVGTGWSFLKPYLQEREKNVLMIVIPMQVIENIAAVVIAETGPAEKDWLTWNQIFLLVDIVCCCAVFLPIIWSIRSLREASKTDGKAARNLQKLTLFKQFYAVVVGYLYFTRIVVSAIGALLSYRYTWVMTAAEEIASLAFYLFVFYNFQPIEKNPYLFIGDEEEKAAAEVLEREDSI